MTRKIYRSAMGKNVDLGALLLQNEQVRAVGNMGVNAVGDVINSTNRVIDQRNRQVQRQYNRQTNVSAGPVPTSNLTARQTKNIDQTIEQPSQAQVAETPMENDLLDVFDNAKTQLPESTSTQAGGLAAAIARSREVKQELEKTRRQQMQDQGLRKI